MMLDTARNKQEQAMQLFKAVGEKWKSLDTKTHKLLQKAIPLLIDIGTEHLWI